MDLSLVAGSRGVYAWAMDGLDSTSPPSSRPILMARVRMVLSSLVILALVALMVVFIVGGASGIADFLHVSETAVAPIGIGALLAAWLAWRAINVSFGPH